MKLRGGDEAWMSRALALAKRARGDVNHYPMVGAVIVKSGKKISEGWFGKPGQPHAEVNAIRQAGARARGATLILNLEPCSHHGTTPPCANAAIDAGIKRVVAGMKDPNPLVAGKGFRKLRAAGIEVVSGVLEDECRELNRVFTKFITTGRPYVIMKAAMTLDGKIATGTGDAFWISCDESRKRAHRLRDELMAVMVGAGTVRADDPSLTARLAGKGRHPRPVILSSSLDIPVKARVMETPADGGPLIFTVRGAAKSRARRLAGAGAEVVVVRKDREGRPDLGAVMEALGKRKIASVLLEGGAGLFGSALRAGVVDEVVLFIAPKLLGGDGVSITSGPGPKKIADSIRLVDIKCNKSGDDLMVTGKLG